MRLFTTEPKYPATGKEPIVISLSKAGEGTISVEVSRGSVGLGSYYGTVAGAIAGLIPVIKKEPSFSPEEKERLIRRLNRVAGGKGDLFLIESAPCPACENWEDAELAGEQGDIFVCRLSTGEWCTECDVCNYTGRSYSSLDDVISHSVESIHEGQKDEINQ